MSAKYLMSFCFCSLSALCKYEISLMRDMCAVPINRVTAAIPCKHIKGRQGEHTNTSRGEQTSIEHMKNLIDVSALHSRGLPCLPFLFVCVCVCELRLVGRKIKKTLGTCKRTLHNQMYGMAIGASLVLHHEVVGTRVVLVGVVNVQRGQVAILTCILQHVIGTEAI